jgi:hypothetical protein
MVIVGSLKGLLEAGTEAEEGAEAEAGVEAEAGIEAGVAWSLNRPN